MLGLRGFAGITVAWGAAYLLLWWARRQRMWREDWHRDYLAVGVLALSVIGFFWPLFFTQSWIPKGGGDLASFIYPIYVFAARWLKRGVVPLWNPHLYMGMPFAADNQSGLFYPINLMFFLLTPELTYKVVELMVVVHVFLAGLFAYLFFRDLPSRAPLASPGQVGRLAALAGAIAYMFSDLFVVHPGNLNIIATAAWLPLALLCFRRALARSSWRWTGGAGIVLGVAALVGHAQMFLYVAIVLALYTGFELYVQRKAGWRSQLGRVGRLALAGLLAFGLAALSLVPAFDMTRYTVRASMSYPDASDFSLPPQGLIGLFVPGFWGRGTGPFWGPWLGTDTGYVGVLPLVLAVVAVALTFHRSSLTRFWVLLGGLGLVIALGRFTVLHGWLYALVPVFRQLRVPARAMFLFDFATAALCVVGLDLLEHPLRRSARKLLVSVNRALFWALGALASIGVPLLGHATIVSRLSPEDIRAQGAAALGSFIFFLFLLATALGWLALRRRWLVQRSTLGAMAVGLIAFDLISLGAYVEIEPNDPLTGYRHDQAMAFLRSDPDLFRVETASEVQGGWAPDWTLIHEMDDWGGIWNPLRLGAYDVLTWMGIGRDSALYDAYNVKYLIVRRDTPVPDHFEPAFDDGERIIYRNPRVLPRAYMVYRAEIVNGDTRALRAVMSPDFDPATEVVLREAYGAIPLQGSGLEGSGSVAVVGRGPNHLDFHVDTPMEGYLYVSEMWLPGWVAYVDGKRQDVAKANYTFRAVHVPAGSREISMVYKPLSWYVGLAMSAFTMCGLVAWAVRGWMRRPQRSAMDRPESTGTY